MDVMKYIISDNGAPMLFSKEIVHDQVLQTGKSAGFLLLQFDILNKKIRAKCFGESTSLNLNSNSEEDQEIIEGFLNK